MRNLNFVILCLLILVLGCQQQEAPLEQVENSAEEAPLLLKPPANSGPFVVRGEFGFWGWMYYDMENNLISIHSWDNAICANGSEMVLMNYQDIHNPSDEDLLMTIMKSKDHWIFVYDWSGLTGDDIYCEMLAERLIAVGKGNLVSTDNDYYHWREHERNRVNAFKTTGQGNVFDAEGNEWHYNLVSQIVWRLDPEMWKAMDKINLVKKGN